MKVWACLLTFLLCTEALAGSFTDEEETILYNFQYLAFSKAWCEDDYIIDMTVPIAIRDKINPSMKDRHFQRIALRALFDLTESDRRSKLLLPKHHLADPRFTPVG